MISEEQLVRSEARRQLRHKAPQQAAIVGVFLGLYGIFARVLDRRTHGSVPAVHPFDFGLLVLASYRLARIVAHEKVAQFMRLPFVETRLVRHEEGYESVEEVPRSGVIRESLGQLLTCSWCSGVWASAALVYSWFLTPRLARPFVFVLATAGGQLLLDVVTELSNKANLHLQGKE